MDEGKRLISYFSHSELLTIGTTVQRHQLISISLAFLLMMVKKQLLNNHFQMIQQLV
jgi:hypothetical protein